MHNTKIILFGVAASLYTQVAGAATTNRFAPAPRTCTSSALSDLSREELDRQSEDLEASCAACLAQTPHIVLAPLAGLVVAPAYELYNEQPLQPLVKEIGFYGTIIATFSWAAFLGYIEEQVKERRMRLQNALKAKRD